MDVDAIEENKIVRVSEEYARREGLLIIRKAVDSALPVHPVPLVQLRRAERRFKPQIEEYRKPLDYKKNNVLQELKENFQWDISKKRRDLGISRRQLAFKVGESEDAIISLENGFLPQDNFVLLNKVEKALGISLRREQAKQQSLAPISRPRAESSLSSLSEKPAETEVIGFSGEDIELE